jgi:Lipocalin-like domain
MRSHYLPTLVVVLGLAATTALSAEASFVGIWYSAFQPDEPNVMSLIEFKADGTFHEEFRKCQSGDYIGYQTESGTWSVSDGVEHIKADMINGTPANVQDTYKIELLTDSERRIRLDPEGYIFVGHRVAKFEFPACPNGA